jgi:hypothetical protein
MAYGDVHRARGHHTALPISLQRASLWIVHTASIPSTQPAHFYILLTLSNMSPRHTLFKRRTSLLAAAAVVLAT